MKAKPRPKKELVVNIVYANILSLYAISEDAVQFVRTNAPEYGSIIDPLFQNDSFILFVLPNFDVNEVAAYLESYNDNE